MPHQDHGRETPAIGPALDWLVSSEAFGSYTLRSDSRFTPTRLVRLTLLWAWGEQVALGDRLAHAQEVIDSAADDQPRSITYQAFVKLLRRHSAALLYAVVTTLQARLRQSLADSYRVAGFLVFGVDGTRLGVPRTKANEASFSAVARVKRRRGRRSKADRKKAATPRVWLTTLWHVGTGLPWGWRSGPSDSSEREHLPELLAWLPERSLVTADAGFVGYDLCGKVIGAGHDFLIRVGGNVRLLKKLGYAREHDNRVYLWPERAARKRRSPIVLRLVVSHDGKQPVYLVTTVLAQRALSDRRVIELYRRRWGVEVFYRGFKRTFARHKLRSASPRNALVELDWSMAALWAACLYAKHLQARRGEDLSRTSVAGVLRVLRRAAVASRFALVEELAVALVDPYERTNKASRDYPIQKTDYRPAGPPDIRYASPELKEIALQLRGFTA